MTTAQVIGRIIQGLISIAFWGYAIYSVIIGFRHGFKFPRSLHWIAVILLAIEIIILMVFPIEVRSISPILATVLVCLPVSPYVGWAISGGPVRCRDEMLKHGVAEHKPGTYFRQA